MADYPVTPRNRVRRVPARAHYDRDTVYSILDAARICHVGLVDDQHPVVIPTIFGRRDDVLYLHGANTSRLIRSLEEGVAICISVAHVDGLVLARSAFHHALNYRSVVLFGEGRPVSSEDERLEALQTISEQVLPGRWEEVRPPTPKELGATKVIKVELNLVSAKVREGGPVDDEADYALPIWAGYVPMSTVYEKAVPDGRLAQDTPLPSSVTALFNELR